MCANGHCRRFTSTIERWRATTKHYETLVDRTNTKTEGCIVRVNGCGESTNIQRTNGQRGTKRMNDEQSEFPVKRQYPTLEAQKIRNGECGKRPKETKGITGGHV